jgi:hypothetical protein
VIARIHKLMPKALQKRYILAQIEKDYSTFMESDFSTWMHLLLQCEIFQSYNSIVVPNEADAPTATRDPYNFAAPASGNHGYRRKQYPSFAENNPLLNKLVNGGSSNA